MSAEDIARMENEMESLERDLKAVTDNYTENMFYPDHRTHLH